ncbi:TasA family protein [Fictibacillus sp. UD]|uniref:TasA family protein n=1 Tax=Fictibacillus sp. UD TaxID=3038777 RepID=UPI00374559BF
MSLKKKLGLGVASAALGLSLVGGGTYAYFSDTATTNNTFAAGTLDLAANPTKIFDLDNLKPGDSMYREFELQNKGTLNIKNVVMNTSYTIKDAKGDNNGADLGEHIKVHFMLNWDKTPIGNPAKGLVVWDTTLAELQSMSPKAVEEKFDKIFGDDRWGTEGLATGTSDWLGVYMEFVDNKQDQNVFQGDTLKLKWEFTANQTDGELR